jgi:hypothetical protein
VTSATEPPSQTARIRRWLLSDDPHIRTHTAMSGLALVLMACCVGLLLWLALNSHPPVGSSAGAWCRWGPAGSHPGHPPGLDTPPERPSLTLPQMLWAITSAAVAYLVVADARDMLPCMVAMVLLFGSLGLRMRQIVGITVYALWPPAPPWWPPGC